MHKGHELSLNFNIYCQRVVEVCIREKPFDTHIIGDLPGSLDLTISNHARVVKHSREFNRIFLTHGDR